MDYVAVIGILCTVLGVVIGYLTYKRNATNDLKKDTTSQSIISTKLDYIGKGVDEIKQDLKSQDREINSLRDRVVKVEESTKSAHKRLDNFERND